MKTINVLHCFLKGDNVFLIEKSPKIFILFLSLLELPYLECRNAQCGNASVGDKEQLLFDI